jgi:hypothetical protein
MLRVGVVLVQTQRQQQRLMLVKVKVGARTAQAGPYHLNSRSMWRTWLLLLASAAAQQSALITALQQWLLAAHLQSQLRLQM